VPLCLMSKMSAPEVSTVDPLLMAVASVNVTVPKLLERVGLAAERVRDRLAGGDVLYHSRAGTRAGGRDADKTFALVVAYITLRLGLRQTYVRVIVSPAEISMPLKS
jgi:hypothetical protein